MLPRPVRRARSSNARSPPSPAAIDRETFSVLWDLSAPGGAAEHCLMRVPQADHLLDGRDECLDWMPDVSPQPSVTLAR